MNTRWMADGFRSTDDAGANKAATAVAGSLARKGDTTKGISHTNVLRRLEPDQSQMSAIGRGTGNGVTDLDA